MNEDDDDDRDSLFMLQIIFAENFPSIIQKYQSHRLGEANRLAKNEIHKIFFKKCIWITWNRKLVKDTEN